MTQQNDQPVKFRDDGTVTCTVAGQRHRLRRPQMAEIRELRELWGATEDDVLEAADPYRAPSKALGDRIKELRRDPDATDDDYAEARRLKAESREMATKIDLVVDGHRARWVREAFGVLSDHALPDPEDDDPARGLEPWMVGGAFAPRLILHWRNVPFDSGPTETPTLSL